MTSPSPDVMKQFIRESRWVFTPQDFPEFHVVSAGDPRTGYAEWKFIGFDRLFKRLSTFELHDLFILVWLQYSYWADNDQINFQIRAPRSHATLFTGMQNYISAFSAGEGTRWFNIITRSEDICYDYNRLPGREVFVDP